MKTADVVLFVCIVFPILVFLITVCLHYCGVYW